MYKADDVRAIYKLCSKVKNDPTILIKWKND